MWNLKCEVTGKVWWQIDDGDGCSGWIVDVEISNVVMTHGETMLKFKTFPSGFLGRQQAKEILEEIEDQVLDISPLGDDEINEIDDGDSWKTT